MCFECHGDNKRINPDSLVLHREPPADASSIVAALRDGLRQIQQDEHELTNTLQEYAGVPAMYMMRPSSSSKLLKETSSASAVSLVHLLYHSARRWKFPR